MRSLVQAVILVALGAGPAWAQGGQPQTQEDDYTRYELLAPGTGQFRIVYDVTSTTAGAPFFFNAIRKGSIASDEHVYDAATGTPLKWEVVPGSQARAEGHPAADLETEWIKVYLARRVPVEGEARVVIDKTYKDDKSYYRDGDLIVFDRPLGIRRNSVVLPAGYRLVSCNVPSQVLTTPDGRVMIAFMNPGPAAAPLVVKATSGLPPAAAPAPAAPRPSPRKSSVVRPLATPAGPGVAAVPPTTALDERAHQDREITYRLNDPASHAFEVIHDYTEARVGISHYLNVLPQQVQFAAPSVRNLDTGEALQVQVVSAQALATWKITPEEPVPAGSRVVLAQFPAITAGHSVRLRVAGTMGDTAGYRLDGDDLVWDRVLDRSRSTVVLPLGWTVVGSSVPGTVDVAPDGRQRLYFENARPDLMAVLIRARRRR